MTLKPNHWELNMGIKNALCKTSIVTRMVIIFPEKQSVILDIHIQQTSLSSIIDGKQMVTIMNCFSKCLPAGSLSLDVLNTKTVQIITKPTYWHGRSQLQSQPKPHRKPRQNICIGWHIHANWGPRDNSKQNYDPA